VKRWVFMRRYGPRRRGWLRISWHGFATTSHWLKGTALISFLIRAPEDEGGTGWSQVWDEQVYKQPPLLRRLNEDG
jgi:hypothetical protein